jgi:hypothetical protein
MNEDTVLSKVKTGFPKARIGGLDFIIPLDECEADFYRASSTELVFHIKPMYSAGSNGPNPARTVAAAEMLIRATDSLWSGLEGSLRTGMRKRYRPKLTRCSIEDTMSTTALLTYENRSPLLSAAAKVAYGFSLLYIIAAVVLAYWQFAIPNSKDVRQANVLGIALALLVAAVSTPVPVFMSWREWKSGLSWKYVRSAP